MGRLIINLPEAVEPYEDDIRRFVDAMIYKLGRNAHKGKWEDLDLAEAVNLLRGETDELIDAITNKGNFVEVLLEAADVGNFAMIAASIATVPTKGVAATSPNPNAQAELWKYVGGPWDGRDVKSTGPGTIVVDVNRDYHYVRSTVDRVYDWRKKP